MNSTVEQELKEFFKNFDHEDQKTKELKAIFRVAFQAGREDVINCISVSRKMKYYCE